MNTKQPPTPTTPHRATHGREKGKGNNATAQGKRKSTRHTGHYYRNNAAPWTGRTIWECTECGHTPQNAVAA